LEDTVDSSAGAQLQHCSAAHCSQKTLQHDCNKLY